MHKTTKTFKKKYIPDKLENSAKLNKSQITKICTESNSYKHNIPKLVQMRISMLICKHTGANFQCYKR
jgi:hypothetical protein